MMIHRHPDRRPSRCALTRRPPLLLLAIAAMVVRPGLPTASAARAEAPAAPPAARAETDLGDNAALRYWPAFYLLDIRDPEQEKLLPEWRTAPLDERTRSLVRSKATSLHYLHDGAKIRRCDWGLNFDYGFGLLLPHLNRARALGNLACLDARVRLGDGTRAEPAEQAAAVDDLADAMALARHAAPDGIQISVLVGYGIEGAAIDAAADHLPVLGHEALDRLAGRIEKLPPGSSIKDSVRIERQFGQQWLLHKVRDMQNDPHFVQHFVDLIGPQEGNRRVDVEAAVRSAGGTAEGVARRIEALGTYYDQFAAILALPYDQAKAKLADLDKKAEADPFAKMILPAYTKSIDSEARARARMALLKAAIVVAKSGPEKAKDSHDPYGNGPFEYRAPPGGFELKSKLTYQGEPVALQVGQAGKK